MAWPQPFTVSVEDLSRAFDDLISGSRTREEVSDWARDLRLAADDDRLRFEPESVRPRLWEAIIYLEGVDLKDSPSTYLLGSEDFETFRKTIGL